MLHPALGKLLRLQWRGGFRQFRRSLRTFRGLFQLGFMLAGFGYLTFAMVLAQWLGSRDANAAQQLNSSADDLLAVLLFVITSYTILFSTGEATVYFTSSEVAFLFPAPITRRQLLAYKLVKSLLGIVFISLIFSMMAARRITLMPATFAAIFLTIWFLSLLTMNVAFLRHVVQSKVHVLIRRLLAVIVGLAILAAAQQAATSAQGADFRAFVMAFKHSTIGSLLLGPFQILATAIRAPTLAAFAWSAMILLFVDLALLYVAFRLDSLSLEIALAISEKFTARINLMRTKGVWQALGTTDSKVARRRIPLPPFWAGIGPVLWQRLTTTLRSSTNLLWLLFAGIVGVGAVVYLVGRSSIEPQVPPIMGAGLLGYVSFLICLSMQHDIDRVGFLKSLPIRTTSIVIGDLIGFPILVAIIQSLFLAVEACVYPQLAAWLLFGALLAFPFNFLLFGIDKLVFYVYPTRLAKGAPGDFQAAGKQMIFVTLKGLMLLAFAAVVAVATAIVAVITHSLLAAMTTVSIVLVIECTILVPLLALAFNRFDAGLAQTG